jgi:murein DD-endopeptidase MepM/ murein hydrolase activator NlpD
VPLHHDHRRARDALVRGALVATALVAVATGPLAHRGLAGAGETSLGPRPAVPHVPVVLTATDVDAARAIADEAIEVAAANRDADRLAAGEARAEVARLAAERDAVAEDVLDARTQLAELSVVAYTTAGGRSVDPEDVGGAIAISDPARNRRSPQLVAIATTEADRRHDQLLVREATLEDAQDAAEEAAADAADLVLLAEGEVERAAQQAEGVEEAAAAIAAGAPSASVGFRFPVAAPHRYIDSWGFARSGGRHHEGTDVFADFGAAAVAVEHGRVERIGSNGLGGMVLWLVGDSGTEYYYAHLSGFAPRLQDGQRVSAGTTIAFVGESGNAAGTGAHLHFEVHPGGGGATNPYPILSTTHLEPGQERLPGG